MYAASPTLTPEPFRVPDLAAASAAVVLQSGELAALVARVVEHYEALNKYGRARFLADLKHHFPVLQSEGETPEEARMTAYQQRKKREEKAAG